MRKMLFAALLLLPVTAAHGGALAPHRAIYDLVRDPSAPGTQVDRAQGRIAFQLTRQHRPGGRNAVEDGRRDLAQVSHGALEVVRDRLAVIDIVRRAEQH
ncbi:MAG TPA: DUF1849 family protein, partial [Xanthobacteraceae bacterium]|nr:DUF1849 family protein [Xanthobacteraceae bacterium]